ncbi:MAG TPA: sigma-70 family RNA polymerase sigma factor [Pirellulales bacterium]|nr:sigma-70 family RNA polymerase sigma factor [Pirellulales bacterium]
MTDVEPTDESLLATFRETGDAELLDVLLRRHLPRVRSTIGQLVLNDCDADDLTQEVFLRAVRGLAQFAGRARFSTWLYRVAINLSRSYLARRGRALPASTHTESVARLTTRAGRTTLAIAFARRDIVKTWRRS